MSNVKKIVIKQILYNNITTNYIRYILSHEIFLSTVIYNYIKKNMTPIHRSFIIKTLANIGVQFLLIECNHPRRNYYKLKIQMLPENYKNKKYDFGITRIRYP